MSQSLPPNGDIEQPWKAKSAAKRAAELAKIPSEWRLAPEHLGGNQHSDINVMDIPAKCGILTQAELDITERFTAISLAKAVRSGSLTASAVAVAFCKRAAIAQQLTNCLTETFFDDAMRQAAFLDDFLAKHGRPVGPLHGVPVSLKDLFNYAGVPSTIGMIAFLDNPIPDKNSTLADTLLSLGAILYCKTNVPQTMMSGDSDNNLFGRVLNPHKLNLGPGGSSGGEGALVAMRGSVLGVGTDIGGSVRIPALCCGTYGFKPSSFRIPQGGCVGATRRGSPGFPSVAGPLANSFEDLNLFLQSVLDTKPWNRDVAALAIPWRSQLADVTPPGLRIGYMASDPDYPIHPPVMRALETSARKLAAAGLTIVPIKEFPALKVGAELCWNSYSLDNSKIWLQNINAAGEPIIPSLIKQMSTVDHKPDGYTVGDIFELNVAKLEYKAAWNNVFVDNSIDVLLCPGAQSTAVSHDEYGAPVYTAVFNLLEYCGLIIPVGKADKSVDVEALAIPDPHRPYNAEVVHEAPTTIQLIARNYHDEELVAAGRVIDQCLNNNPE